MPSSIRYSALVLPRLALVRKTIGSKGRLSFPFGFIRCLVRAGVFSRNPPIQILTLCILAHAGHLPTSIATAEKQGLLETVNPLERLQKLQDLLEIEIEKINIRSEEHTSEL